MFKFLRIRHDFINPCECKQVKVHSYCMTAQVIYNEKIYCEKCDSYYKLFIKKEKKFCNGPMQKLMTQFVLLFVSLLFMASLMLILDGYLKTEYAKKHPEKIEAYLAKYKFLEEDYPYLPAIPDHRKEFNLITSVWWFDLFSIGALIGILQSWCFYFHFER